MALSPLAGRSLTFLAVGVLGFDGAALVALGLWTGRVLLTAAGVVVFLASGLVLLYWRRHLRALSQIAADRGALKQETEDLRRLSRN